VTEDPDHIWERFDAHLRTVVATSAYDIWLARLRLVRLAHGTLVVAAPHDLHGWVAERYRRALETSAEAVLGEGVNVTVVSADEARDGDREPMRTASTSPLAGPDAPDELNPKYTFDQFVIGDANRVAHGAALAVAELPGQTYNPLFLYGPPGVGKTHLLHSIGNYVRAYGEGLTVRYTTIETFTNEFVGALHGGNIDRFKDCYRHVGVLLIDDVQFLASKERTEEEFFHTFNALHAIGSQLVLTSDRLPRDLAALEDRLRDRFESGLVTDIRPPDRPTRMAVLRKRVLQDDIGAIDDPVLELIADRVRTNVRALEGALIRVVAFASLRSAPLTPDLAGTVLDDLYPQATGHAGAPAGIELVDRIQDLTAELFGLSRADLLGPGRTTRLTWPRHVAMYLARENTEESLPAIGARFHRNHTTVLHACRATAKRLAGDPEAVQTVRQLTDRLHGARPDRDG
jgi:chromosomal replication initiator protein